MADGTADGPLAGITVLDFSTVGPAARCSRMLADYGAEVVKVGRAAQGRGVQIDPPFYAYSGQRGMERALFDLKSPAGRDAFLRAGRRGRRDHRELPARRRRPPGHRLRRRAGRNPAIVYCSTSGLRPGRAHAPPGRATTSTTWRRAATSHCSGRTAEGAAAAPGRHRGRQRRAAGMHAAMAILAALVRPGPDRRGRVPRRVGGRRRARAACRSTSTSTWPPARRRDPGTTILTGRYACYDVYAAGDGGWLAVGAIEPAFWANLCRLLGLERWIEHQTDDDVQDEIRADVRGRASPTRDRDEWVAELRRADTCVAPVLDIAEVVDDAQFAARGAIVEAAHPDDGAVPPGRRRCWPAPTPPRPTARSRCRDAADGPTPRSCSRDAPGLDRAERDRRAARGRSDAHDPADRSGPGAEA